MSKLGFSFGIFFSTCFDHCGREPSTPAESGKAAEKKASSLMDSVMKQIVPTPAASLESSMRFRQADSWMIMKCQWRVCSREGHVNGKIKGWNLKKHALFLQPIDPISIYCTISSGFIHSYLFQQHSWPSWPSDVLIRRYLVLWAMARLPWIQAMEGQTRGRCR